MNRIYFSIWNEQTGTYVAAPETAHSAGKPTSSRRSRGRGLVGLAPRALSVALMLAFGTSVLALPQGGVVTSGNASLATGAGSTTITQRTPGVVIQWDSFGVGAGELVRFVQPSASAVALNRVLGADASRILGSLQANGRVFLINPNGILFGQGAQVNVGGLVASTLHISDANALAGQLSLSGDSTASVVNQGLISAPGGHVALLGAQVSNEGAIVARLGAVALVAGQAMTLDVAGDGLLHIAIDQGAVDALVHNGGLIQADGGQVVLSARAAGSLLPSAVNNSGVIQAQTIGQLHGHIVLLGNGPGSTVDVAGTLDASGLGAGQTGGTVQLLGDTVRLSGATVQASGDAGGGQVLVGGNFHGTGPQPNATRTTLDDGTSIRADALGAGNGGQIAVWSDGRTEVGGTLSAQGGAQSGHGGFIETSGQKVVLADSARVNTLAARGATGLWLLDPPDYIIAGAGGDETPAQVSTSLALSNRLITATNDVLVNDALTWSTAQTLTLNAAHDVRISAAVTASTAGSGIVLVAGNDVSVTAAMTASGARSVIRMTAGRDVTTTAAVTASASGAVVQMTAGRTASVGVVTSDGGGSIDLRAAQDVVVNGAVTADGGPVNLRADNDGTGPGLAGGTVVFAGAGTVSSPNTTIRFNPNGYANTAAEIAAYTTHVVGALDARAWVFGQAQNKVYDGFTPATLAFRGTPSLGGDVSLVPGTANFDTKDVGTGKTVTFTGYTLAGANVTRFDLFAGSGTSTADITPAPLTVTATNVTKPYGTVPTLSGFTSVGLVNAETIGSVTEVSPGSPAAASVAGSPYVITPSAATGGTFLPGNYAISYVNGNLTITPVPLTVTATDVTKPYGTAPTLSGFTSTGLVNAETIGSVTEVSPGSPATAPVAGSPYVITPSAATGGTFTPGNYVISYVNGNLTITPAPLTVTATDVTKPYGTVPTLSGFISTGLANAETIGSVTEVSPGSPAAASVAGSPYVITPSAATGGTFTPGNYVISYVNGNLTITPAPLTVTATDVTKTYGTAPTLSGFTSAGLVNAETIGSVTEASPGSPATAPVAGSPYTITPSAATGGTFTPGNYVISYVNGNLTITPAPLTVTVTAGDVSKTYGSVPTLGAFTSTGLVNAETIGSVTEVSPGSPATAPVAGSPYVITPSAATGGTFTPGNYVISYVNGNLTITPAPLTVTATDVTKPYGTVPTLSGFTAAGLVNAETIGSVTEVSPGSPAAASVAGSPYVITPSAATGGTFTPGNYVISYVNGNLTITPAPLTVTAADVTKTYGTVPVLAGFIPVGLVNAETIGSVTEVSPGSPATAPVAGSPYVITPSAATGGTFTPGNYVISYVGGVLTVVPAPLPPLPPVPPVPWPVIETPGQPPGVVPVIPWVVVPLTTPPELLTLAPPPVAPAPPAAPVPERKPPVPVVVAPPAPPAPVAAPRPPKPDRN